MTTKHTAAGYDIEFRSVGFTDSTYMDGSPEVGWKGDFQESLEDARAAGCGGHGYQSSEEVRLYVDRDFIASVDNEGRIDWEQAEFQLNEHYTPDTAVEILKELKSIIL